VEERVRVLRVIARLNVGGPALHVSYLAKGLTERGYDTMLVAGRVGDSEGSMEYASRELGVEPHYLAPLKRDISAWSDSAAMWSIRGSAFVNAGHAGSPPPFGSKVVAKFVQYVRTRSDIASSFGVGGGRRCSRSWRNT